MLGRVIRDIHAANTVLAAAGYNFRLLVLWLSILRAWFTALLRGNPRASTICQGA